MSDKKLVGYFTQVANMQAAIPRALSIQDTKTDPDQYFDELADHLRMLLCPAFADHNWSLAWNTYDGLLHSILKKHRYSFLNHVYTRGEFSAPD